MFVTKLNKNDSHGRVWHGSSYFVTASIDHWETVVGPANVFVSPHFDTLHAGLVHPEGAPIVLPPAPEVPTVEAIAKAVAAKIKGLSWRAQ